MSKLLDAMRELNDLLVAASLPEELVERMNAFIDANPDPENLTLDEQGKLLDIVKELDKHNALHLLGLVRK